MAVIVFDGYCYWNNGEESALTLNGPFVPFFHGLALSLLVWTTKTADDKTQPPAPKPLLADGA